MSDPPMVEVVLPVLNEAEALGWVLDRMPPGYVPLVVDNGSTDGSGEIAADLGARLVTEPLPGFGAACFAGLEATKADYVAFMDADGSLDPMDLPTVATAVLAGTHDLCLGARQAQPGAWSLSARMANRCIAARLNHRLGTHFTDLGPMRVARTESLRALGLADRRFGWPLEMVMKAAKSGWSIQEMPVAYYPRRGGKSKVSGDLRGALRATKDMALLLR